MYDLKHFIIFHNYMDDRRNESKTDIAVLSSLYEDRLPVEPSLT